MDEANHGHAPAYGDDVWTARAADAFRALFETDCEVFFAFNGTAANSLALASLCQSYHSVICSETAHVETDECGAPEFFSNGSKLLVAPSADGKLTPEAIRAIATNRSDIHFPKPRVVTITQPTETGQVYSLDELRAISAVLPGTRAQSAHGRRALRQCLRQPRLQTGRHDLARRRRRAVLRRHQERHGGRRSHPVLQPEAGGGFRLSLQAGRAAGLEDALSLGALGRHARERRLAAQCRARQRLRAASARSSSTACPGSSSCFRSRPMRCSFACRTARLAALRDRGWRFYTFIGGGARFMFAWDADPRRVEQLAADIAQVAASLSRRRKSSDRRQPWRLIGVSSDRSREEPGRGGRLPNHAGRYSPVMSKKASRSPSETARGLQRAVPCRRLRRVPPQIAQDGRKGRPRQGRGGEDPRCQPQAAERFSGKALCAGPLVAAADLPGHGCGRQGQRHQEHVRGRQSAGLRGLFLQAADRPRTRS